MPKNSFGTIFNFHNKINRQTMQCFGYIFKILQTMLLLSTIEMSASEKARFKREKTSSKKITYQHRRKKRKRS